jgi:hypothetical protein
MDRQVERMAVGHLLEALRIAADDYEDATPGRDSGELVV